MDLGTAVSADAALAGLCVLTLGVASVVARRERKTTSKIDTHSEQESRAGAKVRLLEVRAVELAREIEELERAREEILVSGAGVMRGLDLRATLGNGIPRDRKKVVSVPEAAAAEAR